ncbi:Surface antigen [Filimonas lacunae]|uniref:Surface antigen n=1 Tax=Filimonas lacunae TaxID=477680 RepID=A0A173MAX8_9BACT|nr:BamA/TamA family outer membrane protein [Filimonas lacunae]BAV04641.1 outer membrane protein [Filimonas lacunae]SIT32538.1 Surface antigen [Filimonas lacunae]
MIYRIAVAALLLAGGYGARAQDTVTAVAPKKHWLGKFHPDSIINGKLSIIPVPVITSSPETGLRGGVVLQYFLNTGSGKDSTRKTRDSYSYLEALYSTRRQTVFESYTQMFTPGEKYFFRHRMGYVNNNERIWGFGNKTMSAADFEKVTYTRLYLQTSFTRQIKNKLFAGLNLNVSKTYDVVGTIKDSNLLAGQPGENGYLVIGLGPTIIWDKRDHPLNTRSGWYGELAATHYMQSVGSDFSYTEYLGDIRKYFPLRDSSVLAFQGYALLTGGTVPWREKARMGNSMIMRGYFSGRFRDNQYAAAQAEYRKPVHRWVTLAVFAAAGQVQHTVGNFNISDTKFAGGIGMRVLANKSKRIYLRFDYAVSSDKTSGFYFKVGEAF